MTRRRFLAFASVLLALSKGTSAICAQTDDCVMAVIETIAGTGDAAYSGDGGPAGEAGLRSPTSIAVGSDGCLFIAEEGSNRVRKIQAVKGTITPDSTITTVAGSGAQGCSGDGGPATEARLRSPQGVAVGPDGSLFIADTENDAIRKVGRDGVITTVLVSHLPAYSCNSTPAPVASFMWPKRVAVADDGSLYVADTGAGRILKVNPGGVVATVADRSGPIDVPWEESKPVNGVVSHPSEALAWGDDGNLYVAGTWLGDRVCRIYPDGFGTIVAGHGWRDPNAAHTQGRFAGDGGFATDASLNHPNGLAARSDHTVFIADAGNRRVRRVDPGGIITTVAGNGQAWGVLGCGIPAAEAGLIMPTDVAVGADGSLYIVDCGNCQLYRLWWRPGDPDAAKAKADDLRAKADDSPRSWREVAELYLIAKAWDDALAAAERVLALTPEADGPARMRAEALIARVYAARDDAREARRRLMRILARADDSGALHEAADALVDLYLERGKRDQAIATLSDLRLRTNDRRLLNWIDQRLKQIAQQ